MISWPPLVLPPTNIQEGDEGHVIDTNKIVSALGQLGSRTDSLNSYLDGIEATADSAEGAATAAQTAAEQAVEDASSAVASIGLSLALTGAVQPTRYVGATVTGAPTTGSFDAGDFVVEQDGGVWVCQIAGSPGYWVEVGGQRIGQRMLEIMEHESDDVSMLVSTDSVGAEDSTVPDDHEWVYKLGERIAAAYPAYTVIFRDLKTSDYTYNTGYTIQTGSGAKTLTIWGAGTPGKYTFEQQAHLKEIFSAANPNLIFVSQGHNWTGHTKESRRWTMTQFCESITFLCPRAEVVLFAQNVKTTAPDEVDVPVVLRELAQTRGYGFIDMRRAFQVADPTNTLLLADTAHPNQAGYELWADVVAMRMLPYVPNYIPRVQQPSSLAFPIDNLLSNGDFASFPEPPALPNWTASNATLSKDTTNYERSQAYSLRIVPTAGGASSYVEQSITGATLTAAKGRWVTLAARIFVPSGSTDTQAGLLAIRDTNGTNTVAANTSAFDEGRAGWMWAMCSLLVRTDCTALKVRLYGDFGTDGGGDVSIDRAVLAFGTLPREMRFVPQSFPVVTLISSTVAIDSTGVKTVTIPHGLAYTPALKDVMVCLANITGTGAVLVDTAVQSVDATNINAITRVTTAGSASTVAQLTAHVVTTQ